jgi:GNAT superfamily N-acetyltransferase
MNIVFREIEPADIPALFEVRTSTDENGYTLGELQALGITEDSVLDKMQGSYKGWLCELEGRAAGFAMGDRATGELWVIAVRPEHIRRGVGSVLLKLVEEWLFSEGCRRLWLTTDVDTGLRAYSFYRNRGWDDDRIEGGLRYMVKFPDSGNPDRQP